MSSSTARTTPLVAPEPGPTTLKATRWGGTRLAALRGAEPGDGAIGESWEFSTLPGSMSRAQGRPLLETLGRPLPFLAKLIDTAAPLSIQVHPADDDATATAGKEEAWIILDAAPDATVLAGVVDGVDDAQLRAAMHEAIEHPDRDAVLIDCLRRVPVHRGMIIVVPAGTIHAIGPGILLAEIQQPVDCTYRLFDYGSGRPIHPEQAADHWRIGARPDIWSPGQPARPLRGQHVRLQSRGPGTHTLQGEDTPRLLVAVGDGAVGLHPNGDPSAELAMAHGDLLLHTGEEVQVDVGAGAQLVTGTVGVD